MENKDLEAVDIVKFHSKLAAAGGFVLLPVLDFATIAGIQVRMIQKLAEHYDVELSKNYGKTAISTLIAGLMPKTLATSALGSAVKAIPVVGHAASAFTLPAFASASTYALGKVFAKHFSVGGTLFDLDKEKLKGLFTSEMEKDKEEKEDKKAPAKGKKAATA